MNILISGASGGIGRAVEKACRDKGWRVFSAGRDDFTREGDVLPAESFDAFVFAAGVCPVAPLTKTDDELFFETMRVNCGLFLRLMREIVSRRLYSQSGMKVVAVSSVSATEGWSGGSAYCASKGALSALARALDVELSGKGISVKAVEPRHVLTKMFRETAGRMGVPESLARDPGDLAREIVAAVS